MIKINLPYPPTVNHYWGQRGKIRFLTAKARQFRDDVITEVVSNKLDNNLACDLEMWVELTPPDRRKRDIDNTLKPILDALEHANVYTNDVLIKKLHVVKKDFDGKDNAKSVIKIQEMK